MTQAKNNISEIIYRNARDFQIDPRLIAAVIQRESSGNQYACRYEPKFFTKYLQNKTRATLKGHVAANFQTEVMGRAFSYGLMQTMGNTAREAGFKEEYLTALCDPEMGITIGCKILKRFLNNNAKQDDALLAWNGGSDKEYPNRINKLMDGGDIDYLLFTTL